MADQNNPWDTTPAADSAVQSADAWGTPATAPTDGGGADWLTSTPAPNVEHFNILDPLPGVRRPARPVTPVPRTGCPAHPRPHQSISILWLRSIKR